MSNSRKTRSHTAYREIASLFKALSHPTRLEIVDILAQQEACVCHLQAILKKRQPYISQQLMILKDMGLVEDHRDGRLIFYRLKNPNILPLLDWARAELERRGQSLPVPSPKKIEGCSCPHCTEEALQLAETAPTEEDSLAP